MAKAKKGKKVNVQLIPPDGDPPKGDPYRVLARLVGECHSHLADAKIALAWHFGWSADPDGRIKLGKATKASDLDREFHPYDFIILLNYAVYTRVDFSDKQIAALLDHELCHCEVALDSNGVPQQDSRGRTVWRIRKHDVEEFTEIVHRHGCWKVDLEQFAKTALARQPSLFADVEEPPADPAGAPAPDGSGPSTADAATSMHILSYRKAVRDGARHERKVRLRPQRGRRNAGGDADRGRAV